MNLVLAQVTTQQLKQAAAIKEEIEALERQLAALLGGGAAAPARKVSRKISAAGLANIAAAQRARWARQKKAAAAAAKAAQPVRRRKRRLSAEGARRIREANRARWAKARAAKVAAAAAESKGAKEG